MKKLLIIISSFALNSNALTLSSEVLNTKIIENNKSKKNIKNKNFIQKIDISSVKGNILQSLIYDNYGEVILTDQYIYFISFSDSKISIIYSNNGLTKLIKRDNFFVGCFFDSSDNLIPAYWENHVAFFKANGSFVEDKEMPKTIFKYIDGNNLYYMINNSEGGTYVTNGEIDIYQALNWNENKLIYSMKFTASDMGFASFFDLNDGIAPICINGNWWWSTEAFDENNNSYLAIIENTNLINSIPSKHYADMSASTFCNYDSSQTTAFLLTHELDTWHFWLNGKSYKLCNEVNTSQRGNVLGKFIYLLGEDHCTYMYSISNPTKCYKIIDSDIKHQIYNSSLSKNINGNDFLQNEDSFNTPTSLNTFIYKNNNDGTFTKINNVSSLNNILYYDGLCHYLLNNGDYIVDTTSKPILQNVSSVSISHKYFSYISDKTLFVNYL